MEVVFQKKALPAKRSFQRGERLIFYQIGLSVDLTKHTYLSEETHFFSKQDNLAHCFLEELISFLKGILPAT
jgi:hypothetical protein